MARKQETASPFHEAARAVLATHWQAVQEWPLDQDVAGVDPELARTIAAIMRSRNITYRYILPTQLLAKVTDPSLDCHCLQMGRTPPNGNFDARSLNTKVILPFERAQGSPLGGSPEPYVNNPLRIPEISSAYRKGQMLPEQWDEICKILDQVEHSGDSRLAERLLDQVLLEFRRIQNEQQVTYAVPSRISLTGTMAMLSQFLQSRTGGRRPQVVCAALFRTLMAEWKLYDRVEVAGVTAPDTPSGRPADIVCYQNDRITLAVEVKDRQLTLQLLEDKILSSRRSSVTELLFLIHQLGALDEDIIQRVDREFASGLSIYVLDTLEFCRNVLALLGEHGRYTFLVEVGRMMDELKLQFPDRWEWSQLLQGI